MATDKVQRRVRALVLAGVAAAYPRAPLPPVPYCGCGHPDDDHNGPKGDLDCSVHGCGCLRFGEPYPSRFDTPNEDNNDD